MDDPDSILAKLEQVERDEQSAQVSATWQQCLTESMQKRQETLQDGNLQAEVEANKEKMRLQQQRPRRNKNESPSYT